MPGQTDLFRNRSLRSEKRPLDVLHSDGDGTPRFRRCRGGPESLFCWRRRAMWWRRENERLTGVQIKPVMPRAGPILHGGTLSFRREIACMHQSKPKGLIVGVGGRILYIQR